LQIGVMGYAQHPAGAAVDFQNSGYTAGQLGFTGQMAQVFNFLSPMGPGARTHFFTGSVTLRPCEEAPFIVHDVQRQPGEYELVASATFYTAEREHIPLRSSLALDLPLEAVKTKPIQSLTLKANAANDDEWLIVKGNIADEFGADVSLFTKSREQDHFLPGLVEIYSDSGELLPADLDWQEPDGSWRSISLGREGVSFKFRVRPRDRFSRAAVTKIEFTTVTNRGRERFILADHLVASTRPELPAWGDTVGGCRMRIAVPRDCFKGSERVRFFVQAESDGSGADLLWVNSGKFQSQVKAMIDGKQAQIESGGVGDAIVNSFPFQGDVALALIERLAPGKHLLQFAVKGDPGIYENTRGESFRKFDGTLVSNTVEFELRPEK
jgi:hypothetical protein